MESRYDYVLIGSFAAVWAAQTIRKADEKGSILIVGDEPHPPYDRPPLSKGLLAKDAVTPDDAYSKFDNFYPDNHIDLGTGKTVTAIDRAAKCIALSDGTSVDYGKLLIATGSRARRLSFPGASRSGVFVLRHIEDTLAIRAAAHFGVHAVVVGTGYLGIEVGASLMSRGVKVTFVSPDPYPWAKFASPALGRFVRHYFEQQGAQFHLEDEVESIEGSGDAAESVHTKHGAVLPASLVVVCVGASLNLDLAIASGLDVDPENGVMVDEFLQTSDPNIWAAGDIACFHDLLFNKRWHAEHHLNAKWQGQTAGKNMTGEKEAYIRVPYFFSDFLDLHMVLRGDPQSGRQNLVSGDIDGAEFVELYHDEEGHLTCGVAVSRDEPKLDGISDSLERLIENRFVLFGHEARIMHPSFNIAELG
jgi:3-phenylpropionate/trans-cinnamate dioxygenase ferredoxin reductase subunit